MDEIVSWRIYTVFLTLKDGTKARYISSMIGVDYEEAKNLAMKEDWFSGVMSVDNVVFDAYRRIRRYEDAYRRIRRYEDAYRRIRRYEDAYRRIRRYEDAYRRIRRYEDA